MVIYRDSEEKFIKRVELHIDIEGHETDPYLYHDAARTEKVTAEQLKDFAGMALICGVTDAGQTSFAVNAYAFSDGYGAAVVVHGDVVLTSYTAEYTADET